MSWHIRAFSPDHYGSIAGLYNAIYPENPSAPDEFRSEDERKHRVAGFRRWVVEADGQIVAYAEHGPALRSPDPHRFWAAIMVYPGWQRRGIGSALYDLIVASLGRFQPQTLRIWTRDDLAQSICFLERRGFREVMRTWDYRLDVNSFDVAPYAAIEERLRRGGIQLRALGDLRGEWDRDEKLYDLYRDFYDDIPTPEPRLPESFAEFVGKYLKPPDRSGFVAVHSSRSARYIGLHLITHRPELGQLYVEATGVRGAYRRKGVALALKLRGIAYARECGIATIKTFNGSNNPAIVALNERLGFVKLRATVDFVKEMR